MPFENPTALSNFVEVLFILLIPAALTATFGRMVGSARQGWAIFVTMLVLLLVGIGVSYAGEQAGSPAQDAAGISATADGVRQLRRQPRGQGAALRHRLLDRVGRDHDRRLERLGQLGARLLHRRRRRGSPGQHADRRGDLRRGRLRPLRDAAVRPARRLHRRPDGRPHARVPGQEDRGEGDQARDDRDPRRPAARARADGGRDLDQVRRASRSTTTGPQGFSETLYAYGSQANNNGSAFAGFTGFVQPNAPGNVGSFGITFADLLGGFAMLIGRFVPLLAALAVAGSLAGKRIAPAGPGHPADRQRDVRPAPDLRDRRRRRAHVLPGTAARSDRTGPDREVVLMRRDLRTAATALLILTILLGFGYSLALTGISQVVFGDQADGSPITRDGEIVGSKLLGQDFSKDPSYFQSRPSATGYAGDVTYFNNLGPNSRKLARQLTARVDAYLKLEGPYNPGLTAADIPPDAVMTSASGVDPLISIANARIQANRVAAERDMPARRRATP